MKKRIGGLLLVLCMAAAGIGLAPSDAHAGPTGGGAIPTEGVDKSDKTPCESALANRAYFSALKWDLIQDLFREIRWGSPNPETVRQLRAKIALVQSLLDQAVADVDALCNELPERPDDKEPETLPAWG